MTSITELIKPLTRGEAAGALARLLSLAGLPVTSWQPGGAGRTLVETFADILAQVSVGVSNVAKAAHIDTAEGVWLDLLAAGAYQEARKGAVTTRGLLTLTDNEGVGPVTIAAAGDIIAAGQGVEFINVSSGILPLNGTLHLEFEARLPGPTSLLPGQINTLITDIPGVSITNGPDWIARAGASAESDEGLRARCKAKWDSKSSGATLAYYMYHAMASHPDVRRVRVMAHVPDTDMVTVVVAGAAGPLGTEAFAAARETMEVTRRPMTVDVACANAVPQVVPITGTMEVQLARPEALAEAKANLTLLAEGLALDEPLRVAALIEQIMAPVGAVNVALSYPTVDLVHAPDGVFVLDLAGLAAIYV